LIPKAEKSGAGFPAPARLAYFETMTAFWGRAMVSRRKRIHVRTCTTARLAWGAVSAVMAFMTMHFNMVLGLAAMLTLFSFFYDGRTCTFVNLVRSLVMVFYTMHWGFRFSTLGVFCTRVVMMNTVVFYTLVFMMTVMVCLVTFHGLSSSEVAILGKAKQASR
jgi:hypothetical protein